MKKVLIALALASISHAYAADVIVNSTGTVSYGTRQVISVEKNTDTGSNRVAVRYSSGPQYVADDASWTKYGKFVAAMGANGVAVAGTSRVYDVSMSNGVYCQSNQSVIAWPNVSSADYLSDSCVFWQAVKAVAQ